MKGTYWNNFSQASSIDVDLPLEVDDDYWTAPDPTQAFQQPPDKPSQATAFIKLLKLSSIIAYTLQTIVSPSKMTIVNCSNSFQYAVNKSQVKGSGGPMWEQQVLAEIDTLLSKWVDELPPHCKSSANPFDVLSLLTMT
jgi:hypothetical protein